MNNVNVVRIIDEARGFLTGVRLICVPEAIAWIALYPTAENDYYAAPDFDIEVVHSRVVSGGDARKFLWNNLFHRVDANETQKRKLEWYLKDYINLAADADSGVVPSFVVWKNEATFLSLRSSEYVLHGAVVYALANHEIVITLGNATV